jgi:2-polyprenyl-3-methyl-5-hydroxy-6-metoxy-1,4-benzoquinol methylase
MAAFARPCPLCASAGGKAAFPYATRFEQTDYAYIECSACATVYVDPVPDAASFAAMYSRTAYHDVYYDHDFASYAESARLLAQHLRPGAAVLDYGCGTGGFLKACVAQGFDVVGAEFDRDAAAAAAANARCEVMSPEEILAQDMQARFDAVHLGDVLEHLPEPRATLLRLLPCLKSDGVLFVEGPLEANPSLVFWSARIFGVAKRWARPRRTPTDPPFHLIRTNAPAQRRMLLQLDRSLRILHWEICDDGWPYAGHGRVKNLIARAAMRIGGRRIGRATLGNRFRAILRKTDSPYRP